MIGIDCIDPIQISNRFQIGAGSQKGPASLIQGRRSPWTIFALRLSATKSRLEFRAAALRRRPLDPAGGWADVNRTAAQNVAKETLEESGFEVEPLKLAAVWDRTKQGHAPHVFSCAGFWTPAACVRGASRHPGVQKPAQTRHFSTHSSNRAAFIGRS